MTIGEPVPATKAAVGVRWVRMSTDTPRRSVKFSAGRLSLREYLRSIRPPVAPAIYASDDPVPGVLENSPSCVIYSARGSPKKRRQDRMNKWPIVSGACTSRSIQGSIQRQLKGASELEVWFDCPTNECGKWVHSDQENLMLRRRNS